MFSEYSHNIDLSMKKTVQYDQCDAIIARSIFSQIFTEDTQ